MDFFSVIFIAVYILLTVVAIVKGVKKKRAGVSVPSAPDSQVHFEPLEEFLRESATIPVYPDTEGIPAVHYEIASSRAGNRRTGPVDTTAVNDTMTDSPERKRHPIALDKEKLIIYSEIMKPKFDE